MRTPRERFEDNYMAVEKPCNNRRGFRIEYVYYGPWYFWDVTDARLRSLKITAGALFFIALETLLLSAGRDTALNYGAVGLPVGLSLGAGVFSLIGVMRFLFAGRRFTQDLYKDMNRAFTIALPIEAGLLFAATVTAVVVWVKQSLSLSEAAPVFGFFGSAVCLGLLYRSLRKLPFGTAENGRGKAAPQEEESI